MHLTARLPALLCVPLLVQQRLPPPRCFEPQAVAPPPEAVVPPVPAVSKAVPENKPASAVTAVDLHSVDAGSRLSPAAPPIIILHGLLGAGNNFNSWAARLDAEQNAAGDPRRIMLVDLRNHGASPHSADMSFDALAADVIKLLDAQGIERAVLCGHSIGGKVAMAVALLHPQRVERLLVLDMAPVSYDRESFPQWANIEAVVDAMASVNLKTVRSKQDADQQLVRTVPDPALRGFVLTNLVRSEGGDGFRWRTNLQAIRDSLPSLGEWSLGEHEDIYHGNTLFVNGGKSRFLRSSHMPAIQKSFSRFSLSTIRAADHWIHADEPEALLLIATGFLRAPSGN